MIVAPQPAPPVPSRSPVQAAAHARVGPSSLHRIRVCPASLKMQEAFPHLPWEDDESSTEGTCAHWVLQQALTAGARMPVKGDLDPAGTPVTEEILDGVDEAVRAVDDLLAKYGATRADLIIEKPVAIKRIHESCWGTPDIRFWARGVLVVIDFKFGFRFVPEFENEQLVAYTVGEIDEAGVTDLGQPCVNVIIQPRAYGKSTVRSWEFNASQVRGLVNIMAGAVAEALSDEPRAVATVEGCRNCRARNGCPANMAAGQIAMAYAEKPQPLDLSPVALSVELRYAERMLGLLEARVTGLKEQAKYLIDQGGSLPHHALAAGRGKVAWTLPDDQVIAMGAALGLNLAKPPDAITPKQALALGMNDALMPALTKHIPGAMRLVVDDGSTARRVFGAKE